MLITSRSFAEYEAMFDLTEIPATVLDCSAGGSSFVAEANRRGATAIAADPVYSLSPVDLEFAVRQSALATRRINDTNSERFVWSWYGTRARRDALRADAAEIFLADRTAYPDRYIAAGLPRLPFHTGQFDLVVCSHLLFTWVDQFDVDWHAEALTELIRVSAREVRIFPLVRQGTGEPVDFLPELLVRLQTPAEIREVPYEFQRGANEMLLLTKR